MDGRTPPSLEPCRYLGWKATPAQLFPFTINHHGSLFCVSLSLVCISAQKGSLLVIIYYLCCSFLLGVVYIALSLPVVKSNTACLPGMSFVLKRTIQGMTTQTWGININKAQTDALLFTIHALKCCLGTLYCVYLCVCARAGESFSPFLLVFLCSVLQA